MKILRYFIFLSIIVCLASCYKEQSFWGDNATIVDKAVPYVYVDRKSVV